MRRARRRCRSAGSRHGLRAAPRPRPRSQEEVGQGDAERLGLLDVDEVARARDRHELRIGQLADDRVRADRAGDHVVVAGDDERRGRDRAQTRAEVEARELDSVEVVERLVLCEVREELAPDLLVALPAVEVERGLTLRVRDQLFHRRELARLLLLDRLRCLPEPRLAAALLDPPVHRRLRLLAPNGERAHQQEPADVGLVRGGVGHRDDSAVREAEQVELLDAEMLAQCLDVTDVRRERVVVGRVRAERAARAEQDKVERVVETGEVPELGGRPARAARVADEERPAPSPLVREGESVRRAERLSHGNLPSTTLSRPVRSAVIATPGQPIRSSIAATSPAWPSPTSKAMKRARAARASRSCSPSPRRATSGSQRSSPGTPSRLSTYGGLATTTSQPSAATAAPSPRRSSTSRPSRSTFSRAKASAPAETSTPVTCASERSSFSASAIAPEPTPTSRIRGRSTPSASASARSTRVSVSGRGTSARASVFSVSRRKPHSPRTYASGSRASRRTSSGSNPCRSSSRRAAIPDRVVPRRWATSHSASARGVSTPAAASLASASARASRTVTRRARGADRPSSAPR